MAIEGVFGAGVTQTPGGEGAVVVYTKSARVKVPGKLDGVPVIKRVTGEIVALDPTDKFDRPVPIGVSAGNETIVTGKGPPRCTVGTIGARVIDDQGTPTTTDDILYNLGNNHVYAQEGTASIGSGITQPGRVDMTAQSCGSDAEVDAAEIGVLQSYVPIIFSRTANNEVDAAIATIAFGDFDGVGGPEYAVGNSTPVDGYGTPGSVPVAASPGQTALKYGRTTGPTSGAVAAINVTVLIRYDNGRARFVNQIEVTDTNGVAFSRGGDSGALIVLDDGNNSPIGLLFGGGGSSTFANPIGAVLAAFGVGGVTIDGAAPAADTTPPALSSAAVNSTSLVLAYDETLDPSSVPATGDFGIGTDGGAQSITAVGVSGTDVTLTLSPGVASGDAVTVSYTAGAGPIQDIAVNDAVDLVNAPVTNNTPAPDTTPPALSSADVDGTSLVLAYNETLDTNSVPANNDFSVGTDGAAQTVTAVGVSGTDVTLTLSPGVASGDTVTASYTADADPIQDIAGNDAANLLDQALVNNTPAPGGTFSLTVSYATEGGKDGLKHLRVTFAANEGVNPVSGVAFSHTLFKNKGTGTQESWGPVNGATGSDGTVTFTLKNAPSGTYSVTVNSATDDTLTWDGVQPTATITK